MHIAVIDDSQQEREELFQYMNTYFSHNPLYRQVDCFECGEDFLSRWANEIFDLVFIDIYLQGIDGIKIAEKIRETNQECLIIFTTSSEDFAVKGFELRAFDYLVKPFSYEQFERSMDFCDKELRKRGRFIEVKESRTMVKIRLEDIVFTDYFNHYIQIHTKKRVVKSYMRFEIFSPLLLCYPQFLCCYRNCIVNMDKVVSLEKNDFIMETEERVPITRNNRQAIHQKYADYQFQRLNGGL